MSDQDVLGLLCAGGVVPVVVVEDADHVRGLGSALKRGGLPVAEVTFRTEASIRALRALAADSDIVFLAAAGAPSTPSFAQCMSRPATSCLVAASSGS